MASTTTQEMNAEIPEELPPPTIVDASEVAAENEEPEDEVEEKILCLDEGIEDMSFAEDAPTAADGATVTESKNNTEERFVLDKQLL